MSSDFKYIQFEFTSQFTEYELVCIISLWIYHIWALHEVVHSIVYVPYMTVFTKIEPLISKTLCRNYIDRSFGHNATRITHLRCFSDTDTQQSWAKSKLESKYKRLPKAKWHGWLGTGAITAIVVFGSLT